MGVGRIYQASTGQYIGDADLWDRLESGEWSPCCWDEETGREWVKTEDSELVLLDPIPHHSLPDDVEIERTEHGVRIDSTEPLTAP